ncbi:GNAT family N-acetyltransferase [Halomonas sp. 328]|uniref:GNAT family N-acetyltransferase n=1 Tax=Halomonas sp. 328 TaxID=2776704 RepID=UPI0018A6E5DB|nr:GNAT family N-acetyltransferase [Halomonas sp. 328]MBF8222791.1 GNAT family N-acetyltransferase [Halomonas sp. 328]
MQAQLRPGRPEDLSALYALEQRCFVGDRFTRRQLAHLLGPAHASTWLLADGEAILGYGTLLLRRNSRRARLYSFCVAPEARGGGLGRALLEHLEGEARARGCDSLHLEVRADNRPALALYRRRGFRLTRWLDDYYVDGCAAWQMSKSLVADDPVADERPARLG